MERDRAAAQDGWVPIGAASELAGPGPFAAAAGGVELVLVRARGGLRAYEGRCPHQGALLAEGEVVAGGELVCRNHQWRFDVATGQRRDGGGCLRACPLEVRDGVLVVQPDALATREAVRSGLRTVGELPGPRGVPLLGALAALDLDRLHLTLERWAVRYGAVYRMALGPRPVVVLSDAALIQRALRERPGAFRRLGNVEPVFRELGIDGVFSAEGVEWRPLRKLTLEALSPQHLRTFYPALRTVADRLRRRWVRAADAGRAVDVEEDFKRFTVDLTTQLAFGYDLDTLEQEGDVLQRRLEQVFPGLNRRLFAVVPLWRLVKLPAERRLERALAEVFGVLRELLAKARARLEADPGRAARPETFLEAMIQARDDEGRPFTEGQILGNAIQILIAGEDTTALSLSWAVHELCDAPQVVAALQAEADRVLAGAAAPADFEAAGRLEVAGAVANETMRLRPVAPLIFLDANEDVVLGDLALRRGQTLALLMRPPSLSDEHFADPETFRPERWLTHAPAGAHDPSAYMPFGSGPRLCPGRALALLEMRVALATLLGRFALERVGARAEVRERFAFTMGPRGLRVRLRQRDSVV
jgi:cytochrome P450/nitrite reductase/ring-hydroxylating ferredoxin subunit